MKTTGVYKYEIVPTTEPINTVKVLTAESTSEGKAGISGNHENNMAGNVMNTVNKNSVIMRQPPNIYGAVRIVNQ